MRILMLVALIALTGCSDSTAPRCRTVTTTKTDTIYWTNAKGDTLAASPFLITSSRPVCD